MREHLTAAVPTAGAAVGVAGGGVRCPRRVRWAGAAVAAMAKEVQAIGFHCSTSHLNLTCFCH